MDKIEIKNDWDRMAKAYEDFTGGEDSYSNLVEWRTIKNILPELAGKAIIDLGCGTGRFSFLFDQFRPKKITAVDMSQRMLELGRKLAKDKDAIIEFKCGDIENLTEIEDNSFDFVFSSTVTHYLKDLNKVMSEINRILVQGGTCILSVINPVYSACYPVAHEDQTFPEDEEWTINYLEKSERAYIQPWIEYNDHIDNFLSKSYHHTMSDYINAIIKSGFTLKEMLEPMPPEEWKKKFPGRYYSFIETPTYAVFKFEKF